MLNDNVNIEKWKKEQINYFKEYLGYFEKGSREYNMLEKGIQELESSK